jgi:hypothetical protein
MVKNFNAKRFFASLSLISLIMTTSIAAHASESAHKSETVQKTAYDTEKAEKRIARFVETAWTAGLALGIAPPTLERVEYQIRKMGNWAIRHRQKLPSGFSISVDTGAGVLIGGNLGAELVFTVTDEGNVEMGVFSAIDLQVGLQTKVKALGVGVNFFFNIDRVSDVEGNVIVGRAEIAMIEGLGASIVVDVEKEDIEHAKEAVASFVRLEERDAIHALRNIISHRRVVAIGTQFEWGEGFGLSVGVGFRQELGSVVLPKNREEWNASIANLKRELTDTVLKRKALRRIQKAENEFDSELTPAG